VAGTDGALGARLTPDQLFDADLHDDGDWNLLARVVAHEVLSLVGATFPASSAAGVGPGLRKLLSERVPGPAWVVRDDWAGPFDKYSIVHGSLPAPPHEHTGEPMALEVYGLAEGGIVTLLAATYSNLAFPGYRVPLYL
jgi:hypothetical protein